MARGGFRPTAPQNNPMNVSATGGDGQSGKQPARYISGLPYGEGQKTYNQQISAPMAGAPSAPAMPEIVPLDAPTQRPNELMTFGIDIGPGPGSEILNLPNTEPTPSTVVRKIAQFDSSGDAELLYRYLADYGY